MDAEQLAAVGALVLIAAGIYFSYRSRKNSYKNNRFLPYRRKYLLTKNEWLFYKRLKPLADRYGLGITAKIRLADLIEVDTEQTREFGRFFSRISSKHIDFGLVNPENMEVKFLIELDDSSHNRPDRMERDNFINKVCKKTGYVLIRTTGDISEIKKFLKK